MLLIAVAIVVSVVLVVDETEPVVPSAAPCAVPGRDPSSALTLVRLDAIFGSLSSVSKQFTGQVLAAISGSKMCCQ
jgi:hypothetical protein